MNDDDVLDETPITAEALLQPCPSSFVFRGVQYTCEAEETWHSDETLTLYYNVHDDDYEFSSSFDKDIDQEAPKWALVLEEIIDVQVNEETIPLGDRILINEAILKDAESQVAARTGALAAAKTRYIDTLNALHELQGLSVVDPASTTPFADQVLAILTPPSPTP